ncbi:MAG: glycoside hydrolase family 3 protein [Chloroflexi bacterium]|nr:glycoside hydrolase family 3 protein [Chloroflexota bacterium]
MPAPRITIDGTVFRDLNKNGKLDIYEDYRQPIDARVTDLLNQMSLAEKAGLMFQNFVMMDDDGGITEGMGMWGPFSTKAEMFDKHITQNGTMRVLQPEAMVRWHNAMQLHAEETRLGIPYQFSTDPRHGVGQNDLNNQGTPYFSSWPEPIGLAAINDEAVTEQFGDIARQEYRAMGLHIALHPMGDLATEPRWSRIVGTFGEDAERSARMTAAYVRGFQGKEIGSHSVLCMTKHFPGGGPQLDGHDPHFEFGREQVYPGNNFDYHLIPFEAAFAAGTAQIMPYYGMPVGTQYEEVGFGYNKGIITGLLREKYGFDGVICTDWGLITDTTGLPGPVWVARAWGVEHLTPLERVKYALEAGVDQFGGETCTELVIELVESGQVSMERIDQSCRRILRDKSRQGLFENPYINLDDTLKIAGNPEFRAAGEAAQRKAIVPLHNRANLLPVRQRINVYVEGMNAEIVNQYADVVATPEAADMALIRITTPYYPREGGVFLEQMFHSGDLDFKGEALQRILDLLAKVPTIVDIYLDRPAVIPEINAASAGLIGTFGVSDAALCDIVFGKVSPSGTLPFELPSSMTAVDNQKEDLPYDSADPLYPFGHGLTW